MIGFDMLTALLSLLLFLFLLFMTTIIVIFMARFTILVILAMPFLLFIIRKAIVSFSLRPVFESSLHQHSNLKTLET